MVRFGYVLVAFGYALVISFGHLARFVHIWLVSGYVGSRLVRFWLCFGYGLVKFSVFGMRGMHSGCICAYVLILSWLYLGYILVAFGLHLVRSRLVVFWLRLGYVLGVWREFWLHDGCVLVTLVHGWSGCGCVVVTVCMVTFWCLGRGFGYIVVRFCSRFG